jgi:hypothetical protein
MRGAIHLAVVFALSCGAGPASAMQDDKGPSATASAGQERGDPREELEELGATLKAAVFSGALTGESAREIYRAAADRLWEDLKASSGGKRATAPPEADQESPKRNVLRLSAPRPEQIRVLLEAEYLRRDLTTLRAELDFDQSQMMIAEMLFLDYFEAIKVASSPLREALGRYHQATRDQEHEAALKRSDRRLEAALDPSQRIFPEIAVVRTKRELERIASEYADEVDAADEESRAKLDAWRQRMIEVAGQLDSRLASLRERVNAELANVEREDATITAEDLVRMARQLRVERARLREQMADDLELITTEEQRGEENAQFEATMARIRVDRLLGQGRLGGEPMNLWAALSETRRRQSDQLEGATVLLRERAIRIAEELDRRTEATIDRELQGLEYQATRDRIAAVNGGSILEVEERRLITALRPFADAAGREVTASVAVRDALRSLLDESSAYMDELYSDTGLSDAYREAALRRGFPTEMRRRWSERAMAAALKLDGLDDDTREALLAVETANRVELAALRADAISKRIARDPRLAREFIDAEFGRDDRKIDWKPEMWLGINYEAFATIDDRTEGRLRAILTTEQLERLPVRESPGGRKAKDRKVGQKR